VIPRVMHRIWVGSVMPEEFIRFGDGWRRLHPGWGHVLWTDHEQPNMPGVVVEPIPLLKNQALYDAAEAHAPKNIGQFKADVLRYELLLYRGGVYVDADFECRKALDSLLVGVDCFAAWETDRHWVNNAIMGAVPGEPFFQMLVEGLPANVATMRGRSPNVMTGPQFVTQTYRRTLEFHRPTVFSKKFFYPYLWNELHRDREAFPDAYAVHHWNNRRSRRAA